MLSTSGIPIHDDHNGRGAIGLQRSFILAGTQTLVMSLWPVLDQPRLQLLEEFYRRILAGEARADALRAAKLTVKIRYPQELHWGAFVCLGNARPLPEPPGNK